VTVSYFDTSAVVPLLVAEPSTPVCREIWQRSERRLSSVVIKAEVAAALGRAHRMGRIDEAVRDAALLAASRLWRACDFVSVSDTLAEAAARLAVRHRLRGYDAIHVAVSMLVADDAVGVSGDPAMITTWRDLGLPTVDTAVAPP
jgi:predicted nucleic acid-binding protein